jgi:hypothetical protein
VVSIIRREGVSRATARTSVVEGGDYAVCYRPWNDPSGAGWLLVDSPSVIHVPTLGLRISSVPLSTPRANFQFTAVIDAAEDGQLLARRTMKFALTGDPLRPMLMQAVNCTMTRGRAVCPATQFAPGYYGPTFITVTLLEPATLVGDPRYTVRRNITLYAQPTRLQLAVTPQVAVPTSSVVVRGVLLDDAGVPVGKYDRNSHSFVFERMSSPSDSPTVAAPLRCLRDIVAPVVPQGGQRRQCNVTVRNGDDVIVRLLFDRWPVGIHFLRAVGSLNGTRVSTRFTIAIVPGAPAKLRAVVPPSAGVQSAAGQVLAMQPVLGFFDADGNFLQSGSRRYNTSLQTYFDAARMTYRSRGVIRADSRLTATVRDAPTITGQPGFVTMAPPGSAPVDAFGAGFFVAQGLGVIASEPTLLDTGVTETQPSANVSIDLLAIARLRTPNGPTLSAVMPVPLTACPSTATAPLQLLTTHVSANVPVTLVVALNAQASVWADRARCVLREARTGQLLQTTPALRVDPCRVVCGFTPLPSTNASLFVLFPSEYEVPTSPKNLYISGPLDHFQLAVAAPVSADLRRNRAGILDRANITAVDRAGVPLGTRLRTAPYYVTVANSRNQIYRLTLNDGVAALGNINVTIPYTLTVRVFTPLLTKSQLNLTRAMRLNQANRTFVLAVPMANTGCSTPPIITSVSGGGCSLRSWSQDLLDCENDPIVPLTIIGSGFDVEGAVVMIGEQFCSRTWHNPFSPDTQIYGLCPGEGIDQNVTIATREHIGTAPFKLSFKNTPVVTALIGCTDYHPHTAGCDLMGRVVLTIYGKNFGSESAQVVFIPQGGGTVADPIVRCERVRHLGGGRQRTVLNCTRWEGWGANLTVAVTNRYGRSSVNISTAAVALPTISFLPNLGNLCPNATEGGVPIRCGSHGKCDLTFGTCACQTYWVGAACDDCENGRWGPKCFGICDGGLDAPCSGRSRGLCNQGKDGDGTCTCTRGYTGRTCDSICPGGLTTPCNNHGTCTTTGCDCFASATNGFWNGTACTQCQTGYGGSSCSSRCSRGANGELCSGHGTCVTGCICQQGHCGADCSQTGSVCNFCAADRWGSSCQFECPKNTIGDVCSSRGVCSNGQFGNGQCFCNTGYTGSACTDTCPGGVSNSCNKRGTCTSATSCTCDYGFVGAVCELACPVANNAVCNGRGECTNLGVCSCSVGYRGVACELLCPGGVTNICNGHGVCNASASCVCDAAVTSGYWGGTACQVCDSEWFGAACNRQCPFSHGKQCGGHGRCTNPDVKCVCDRGPATGYWAGDDCGECQYSYFGTTCKNICPGSCVPCFDHGTCDMGYDGSGVCSCHSSASQGRWKLPDCANCTTNWYSPTCTLPCPNGPNGRVCSGNGVCRDGITGDGTCRCFTSGVTTGMWTATLCDECADGWYGPECNRFCPGYFELGACSRHGSCDDGVNGTGVCTCDIGYVGLGCSLRCPANATLNATYPCAGRGNCSANLAQTVALCSCDVGFGYGLRSLRHGSLGTRLQAVQLQQRRLRRRRRRHRPLLLQSRLGRDELQHRVSGRLSAAMYGPRVVRRHDRHLHVQLQRARLLRRRRLQPVRRVLRQRELRPALPQVHIQRSRVQRQRHLLPRLLPLRGRGVLRHRVRHHRRGVRRHHVPSEYVRPELRVHVPRFPD